MAETSKGNAESFEEQMLREIQENLKNDTEIITKIPLSINAVVDTPKETDTDTNSSTPTLLRKRRSTSKFNLPQSADSPASKSKTISHIQNIFTDSQKIAYVGLCYLAINTVLRARLKESKRGTVSYEKWSNELMDKLFVYLDLPPEERKMIKDLAEHGLELKDISPRLIHDAKVAAEKFAANEIEDGNQPMDIRYTILAHLFILSLSEGVYDSRSRTLLKTLSNELELQPTDVVELESYIAEELRMYSGRVEHDDDVKGKRNEVEARNRWLYAGAATLVGGAIIGVTAGLAAPLIGAGIGAAFTTFGLTGSGVVGIGSFMASTGGIALITSGGVLTGGGMSGMKMMKRTRGIEEFEFIGIEDALDQIAKNKEARRLERISEKEGQNKVKEIEIQKDLNEHLKMHEHLQELDYQRPSQSTEEIKGEVLWEAESINSEQEETTTAEDAPGKEEDVEEIRISMGEETDVSHQTNVLITIAGWVDFDSDDHTYPFSVLDVGKNGDQYTLIWETKILLDLGSTLSILVSEVTSFIVQQGIQVTLLPVLMGALTGPMWLIKLTYLVDNPWGNAMTKAEKTGRLLADTLIGQAQQHRPVTLVGFSLGARVIYYCLLELAARGVYGIIEEVYIFGTPVVGNAQSWQKIAAVVSGRIVNGFTNNDMLLGVLFRASFASYQHVPGLSPVYGVPGLENVDLTDIVKGHMEYYSKMPEILKKVGFVTNADTFEDQSAEIAKYKELHDKEQLEQKERANADRIRDEMRKLEEEELTKQQQIFAKKLEEERLRLEKEAEAAAKKRKSILKAKRQSGNYGGLISKELKDDALAVEELQQMAEVKDLMRQYWEPREIQSTLPPLVIHNSRPSTPTAADPETISVEENDPYATNNDQ